MRYIQVCKALYDYEARTEDEVSISQDETVYVLEQEDDDWWKVELKSDLVGLVPATYLEVVVPLGKVRAEYDYQAQQEQELSFQEGQEMHLLETDDPDWYLVQLDDGQIGLAPSNYIQVLDDSQASSNQLQVLDDSQALTSISEASWLVYPYDGNQKSNDSVLLYVADGVLGYDREQYPILDITKYLYDDKHVHIKIAGGTNLDLEATTKAEAKAILAKISDASRIAQMATDDIVHKQIAAPASAIVPGHQIEEAPAAAEIEEEEETSTCVPKWGYSLYEFHAEGGDELSVKENEQVYVLDYERLDGWWRIQNVNGDIGIVPSTYVIFDDDNDPNTLAVVQRRKEEEEEKRRREEEERRRREEEERRRREEEERRRREEEERKAQEAARQKQLEEEYKRKEAERQAQAAAKNRDLPKPDPAKIRTWTDKSGTFKVEAQFIDFHNGKLRLHKLNGVKIDVPIEKMSYEDIKWVEKRTKYHTEQEETPVMPPRPVVEQKKYNDRWDWFDWFMMIGIPMQPSLQYASAFKADKLDDSDIQKLTHRQMKTLGIKEEHVRRIEKYIETGRPEEHTEEESKQQIEKDEELARRLQNEWNTNASNERPKPSVSAPKQVHPDLLDFLGNQSNSKQETTSNVSSDLLGFNDDAWTPRTEEKKVISSSPVKMNATPPVPTPEQIKAQEAERRRAQEEEQMQKIQLLTLQKQTNEQKKQLEELQKLTQQQIEFQKQIAMQTGTQQQQHMLQVQAQQAQLQQAQLQAQLASQYPQLQMNYTNQTLHNGHLPPNRLMSDPTYGQWQTQQPTGFQMQQPTGFQTQQQTGFQPNSWQALQPQMTGYPASNPPVGGYQQITSTAGQQHVLPTRSQTINVQPTGRHWNHSTPSNPFGSPTAAPLQAQMTGVQFSTPNQQGYVQPQMTGNNIFTPQGSMQYGQSGFSNQRW